MKLDNLKDVLRTLDSIAEEGKKKRLSESEACKEASLYFLDQVRQERIDITLKTSVIWPRMTQEDRKESTEILDRLKKQRKSSEEN
jgi:hypothetical protein